jgi:CBS domain-containing protein
VAPEDSLSMAARLMHDYDVHHLLVVDPLSRRPVGILSTLDVAAAIAGS